jgi:hypothetical protein
VADGGEVGSDLVAAGVVGAQFDQGAERCGGAAQDLGERRLSAEALDLLWIRADADFATVSGIVGDCCVDDYRRFNDACATSEVALLDLSRL